MLRHTCPQHGFSDSLVQVKIAIARLVAAQLVSLLLKHVVKHLKAQEELLILLLEVLLSHDLECLLVCKRLPSQWVSELGHFVGDWAH